MPPVADIGVIGGSGFYEFLDQAEEVKTDTPFGPPSDPIMVGEVNGRRVASVPRHGRDHRFPRFSQGIFPGSLFNIARLGHYPTL